MTTNSKKDKLKKRFLIGSFFMAALFMAFGSHGSFSPLDIGFYTSIGAAVGWYFLSYYWYLFVLRKRKSNT
nr:hypothetical protein [Cytophagales bacterium]